MSETRECIGIGSQPAHELPWTPENFAPWAMDASRKKVRCRDCDREYRRARRSTSTSTVKPLPRLGEVRFASTENAEEGGDLVPESETGHSHEYIPDPELVALFQAAVSGMLEHGDPPVNLIFYGPSGVGKTDGAAYLAAAVALPFTKVDAASMTDPEAWFGTREIIVQEGVSITKYIPSAFADAIQKAGVVFIDEMNRVQDDTRNVLLPLTDGTGRVTNPLTGEIIVRHPHCIVIMAGNRGLAYTGTSAVDPAFTSRALIVEFNYLSESDERNVLKQATGCDDDTAAVFARFAAESRDKAAVDPDFMPISTREVIAAARYAARGLSRDLAAKFAIINAASTEGGSVSVRNELESIWNGVRVTKAEVDPENRGAKTWLCPLHGRSYTVTATATEPAYRGCPETYCDNTERDSLLKTSCSECGAQNTQGRSTFCAGCGAPLS